MDMDDYQRISQFRPWQRITAVFTLLFFLFQTTSVAVASALSAADIQQSLNDSYEFLRSESNSAYQYVAASNIIDDASLGLSDSEINQLSGPKTVEKFFEAVKDQKPQTLGEPTYIPISTGDITTFIPVQLLPAKVVGSPFVQTRYVRNQVRELLGRHLIDSSKSDLYGSEAKQLQTLYQGAIEYINLTSTPFGQPLPISREGAVSTDMVWPEVRVINDETVLVPVVYLSSTSMERKVEGHEVEFNGNVSFSSISLDSVEIKARGEFLEVSDFLTATNSSIESPNNLSIIAGGPIQLLSSKIDANGDLVIGGHGISASTLFHRYDIGTEHGTRFGEITSISATGDVIVRSYRDIVMQGVNVIAGENIKFGADGNIYIGALEDVHGTQLSGRWKGSTTSVEYLQSHLTAGESIELMAAGQIQLDAVEMIADEGHIEILAGLGITIQDELGQFSKNAKAKFGKKKVTESVYQTVAIRSALDAGKGVKLHSDYGDITLRSVDITSAEGTQVKAENGAVNLLMTAETDHYAYSSVKKGLFTTKTKSKGHTIETGIPNTIVGGFAVEALNGVNIEYEGLRGFDCSDYLAEIGEVVPFNEDACLRANVLKISEMPGMEWMGEMLALADADPTTYNWNEIVLQHKTWSESNTSLSPAFMAVVTIAVAIATQGVGAGLVGVAAPAAGASFAQVATYAALNAGFTTLVSQATIALGNGAVNGDVAGAMEDFASDETVKSLATSMITAGAIAGLDAAFFDVDSIAVNELLEAGPATPEMIEAAKNAATQSLALQVAEVVTNSVVQSGVSWMIEGGSLEELGDAFIVSLGVNLVNTLGKSLTQKIGNAARDGHIDDAIQYISHAGLGCVSAATIGEISEDDPDTELKCLSGGVGATLGEFLAQEHNKTLEEDVIDWVQDNLSEGFTEAELIGRANALVTRGVDLAKLGAALFAFVTELDVNAAASAAEVAARYNANGEDLKNRVEKIIRGSGEVIYKYFDPITGSMTFSHAPPPEVGIGEQVGDQNEALAQERREYDKQLFQRMLNCEMGRSNDCNFNTAFGAEDSALTEEQANDRLDEFNRLYGEGTPGQEQLKAMAIALEDIEQVGGVVGDLVCDVNMACSVVTSVDRWNDGEYLETVLSVVPFGTVLAKYLKSTVYKSSNKVDINLPRKETFELNNGSQVRGSGGVDDKFINTIEESFDPLLSKKAEIRQGADGRWKLYVVGDTRTAKGSYNYVVMDGKIYVGLMKQSGQGHIDIAQGEPVDYAGQIYFGSSKSTKGKLNGWDNASGHYIPEPVEPSWSDSIPLPYDLFEAIEHAPY